MLAIMGCDNLNVRSAGKYIPSISLQRFQTMPLYMHSVLNIIRNMGCDAFRYSGMSPLRTSFSDLLLCTAFRSRLEAEQLNPMQRSMLNLRLDLLESFLRPTARNIQSYFAPGHMTLVDLTDPFLDGKTTALLTVDR